MDHIYYREYLSRVTFFQNKIVTLLISEYTINVENYSRKRMISGAMLLMLSFRLYFSVPNSDVNKSIEVADKLQIYTLRVYCSLIPRTRVSIHLNHSGFQYLSGYKF